MKTSLKLATALVLVSGGTFAASNNMTVNSTQNPHIGTPPATGQISATVISTTAPVAAALPTFGGVAKTLKGWSCMVRDSNGNLVPRKVTMSGTDIVVASSTASASGTLAVGDLLNCVLTFER